ncbi:MAG: helix-turn-helix domain-containing protein, partial [Halolamina sp.]|uniref:helix-turn-helix domain-containing protein n=1 Tax=Halolamina sp. TaxID=1940283 RepID=UPI002FC2A30B
MTTNADTSETMLAPDDAFAVLGNETRMEILQTLGEADEPLPFSELRGRVGMRDSGQFNYHLGKLDGHFIKDTDGGYALGQKGSRVIEAVLSGAVTDTPVLDRTPVDMSCYCCGATPIEFDYHDERLGVYCSECAGLYDTDGHDHAAEQEGGFHGHAPIPPAALQDRTPEELILAAITWWVG